MSFVCIDFCGGGGVRVVAALMSMKSKMIDVDDVLGGWDINSVDPCTWYMVGCSTEGFVISL